MPADACCRIANVVVDDVAAVRMRSYTVADVQIDQVLVDGNPLGPQALTQRGAAISSVEDMRNYTFTNVQGNHTISASFLATTHTITASAGANGSINPSGAVTVNDGASQAFTI